jgi:hypothetical protein
MDEGLNVVHLTRESHAFFVLTLYTPNQVPTYNTGNPKLQTQTKHFLVDRRRPLN